MTLVDVVDAAYEAAPPSAGGVAVVDGDRNSDGGEAPAAADAPPPHSPPPLPRAHRVVATLDMAPPASEVPRAEGALVRVSGPLKPRKPVTVRSCIRDIMAICLPAMGAILADPVMSLVDTACIGQISSVQLAALAPNTAIFNFVFAGLYFLQTAVTALCARALGVGDRRRAGEAFCVGAFLALAIGVGTSVVLEAFAPQLLSLMSTSPEMMEPAMTYLRIRALAAPAVLTCMVVQGACYAQANARVPLVINLTAGVVNLVGDVALVFGPLKMGIAGAAIATVAGQYVAAALSIWTVVSAQRKGTGLPLMRRLPTRDEVVPFFRIASVMLTRMLCIMAVYTLATRSAVALGTLPAAAFQVALELTWFLSFFPEPVSMAAQALLARLPPGINYSRQVGVKACAVVITGAALAMFLAAVVTLCPLGIFTGDANVVAAVATLRLPMMGAVALCCMAMTLDGIFIGLGTFSHLAFFQAANLMLMLPYFMTQATTLSATFWGLAIFFALRCVQHVGFMVLRHNPLRNPLKSTTAASAAQSYEMAGAGI